MKNLAPKTFEKMPNIPVQNLPRGVKWCIDNAERLLNDAELLYKNNRYQSAIVSAIFSFEEIGKAVMLKNHWLAKKEVTHSDWHNNIKKHTKKSKEVINLMRAQYGLEIVRQIDKTFVEIEKGLVDSQATAKSISLKETFLYVNWSKNGWSLPQKYRTIYGLMNSESEMAGIAFREILDATNAINALKTEKNIQQILQQSIPEYNSHEEIFTLIESIAKHPTENEGISISIKSNEIVLISLKFKQPTPQSNELIEVKTKLKEAFPYLKDVVIQ